MSTKKETRPSPSKPAVVLLKDLAPRAEIRGGRGKVLFGENSRTAATPRDPAQQDSKSRSRPGKAPAK
ncbi:MAG: hypothetical protein ACREBK_01860 [Sphingomicrobium sp.]